MKVLSVVVVVMMGVVTTQAALVEDDITDVDTVNVEEEEPTHDQVVPTGRTFSDWGKTIMSWMGYDYDYDDYDYEYTYYFAPGGSGAGSAQVGYGIPSVGYVAPSAGGSHSTYSSYSPVHIVPQQHLGHPARDDDYDDEWSMTDMLFNAAMAAVPVGILIAALPTGFFPVIVRRRSFEDDNVLATIDPTELPLMQTLMDSDLTALTERQCQEKLFCELYRLGEHDSASLMQKAFYYVATLTPDFMARRVGLAHLFRASRAGMCDVFQCSATSGYMLPPKRYYQPTNTNHVFDLPDNPELDVNQTDSE